MRRFVVGPLERAVLANVKDHGGQVVHVWQAAEAADGSTILAAGFLTAVERLLAKGLLEPKEAGPDGHVPLGLTELGRRYVEGGHEG